MVALMSLIDSSSQTTNTTGTQNQTGTQGQTTQQTFTGDQQGLQSGLAAFGQKLMSGQVPQGFGIPQSVADYAMTQFNKYAAPQLANRYGAGSNIIGAKQNELIASLASQAGQQAMPMALNAFNSLTNFATRPTGQTSTGTNNMATNMSQNQQSNGKTIDYGGIADNVGYGLGAARGLF